jgi:hypothetical protein
MSKNTLNLMNVSKSIAQELAPFDTGNLRFNSIRAYLTPTGFRVTSLYTVAFYGAILDTYGVRGGTKHQGWWSTEVNLSIGRFIDSILNEKKNNTQQPNVNVAKFGQGNPERQARFYNSMVADSARNAYLKKTTGE